jgi:hypothetical protein
MPSYFHLKPFLRGAAHSVPTPRHGASPSARTAPHRVDMVGSAALGFNSQSLTKTKETLSVPRPAAGQISAAAFCG